MWFGRRGPMCYSDGRDPSRLIYLSLRWQVLVCTRWRLTCWRVAGFGWGVRIGRIDVVRLP